jgi:acyl carrier protein
MTRDEIADQFFDFLEQERGITREDIGPDDPLFTSGLLDSLELLRFVLFIEGRFGVRVPPLSVSLERFDTVERLTLLVSERLGDS